MGLAGSKAQLTLVVSCQNGWSGPGSYSKPGAMVSDFCGERLSADFAATAVRFRVLNIFFWGGGAYILCKSIFNFALHPGKEGWGGQGSRGFPFGLVIAKNLSLGKILKSDKINFVLILDFQSRLSLLTFWLLVRQNPLVSVDIATGLEVSQRRL